MPHAIDSPARTLLEDFSVEMTGKDVVALEEAVAEIPHGTRINVTYLGNEDLPMRLRAATAAKNAGFVPVPHISARRLESEAQLREFLTALSVAGLSDQVFVVGGDPTIPQGPYASSLDVIRTGILPEYGVRHVSISGYPEGHPEIPDEILWPALVDKAQALAAQGIEGSVITQFGFDTHPALDWLEQLRARGVELPVRLGVPGPAGIKRLISYARRFGVNSSAGIAKKYGFSLTNLLGTAGPDRFILDFASQWDPSQHGEVKLHFYTFGGLKATAEWIRSFTESLQ